MSEWVFRNGKYRCSSCGAKSNYRYEIMNPIPIPVLTKQCPSCKAEMKIALMQRQYLMENDK